MLYALFACTSFTFIGSEYGLKPYFFIWVCLILFAISGKFTIMPPVIARMYGNKYMSINYGLLYTSQVGMTGEKVVKMSVGTAAGLRSLLFGKTVKPVVGFPMSYICV